MDQRVVNGISWLGGLLEVKSIRPDAAEKCKEILDAIEAIRWQAKEIERLLADNETHLNVVTAGDTNIVIKSKEQGERIQKLEAALIKEHAISLLNFQRADDGEKRSWDELSAEEQDARIDYARMCLEYEHKELMGMG